MMKLVYTISLICLSILVSTHAQVQPIQFSLLAWSDSIDGLHYSNSNGDQAVTIPNGAPSDYFSYSGSNQLLFYTLETADDGTILRVPEALVELNPSVKKWLLLFIETPRSETSYRVVPIPDDSRGAQENSFLFYNLMHSDLAVRIDDNRATIANGSYKVIEATSEERQNITVQMATQSAEAGWDIVYQSRWSHPRGRKIWAFLIPGENGRPIIKKFYQRIQR